MNKTALSLTLLAATLACGLDAVPAQAQARRTFVSAAGRDSNPCTVSAPCRSMQTAYNATAPNGEINVLDSAAYGALTITHAISIQGHGWASMSGPSSGTAITITAGDNDRINLRGLILEGFGTGSTGIQFNSGKTLDVQDSVIRNFTPYGMRFQPSGTTALLISNTRIAGNYNGIYMEPPASSSGTVTGALSHVWIEDNDGPGLAITGRAGTTIAFSISDSDLSNNNAGVSLVPAGGGVPAIVTIRNCDISNNINGLFVSNLGGIIRVGRSTIAGNTTGLETVTGGLIQSYGDNYINGNTTDGAPTSTIPTH